MKLYILWKLVYAWIFILLVFYFLLVFIGKADWQERPSICCFLLSLSRFSFLSKPVDENHQDGDDDSLVSRFYTNPIAKPIPQTPESAGNKHNNSNSVDDTIVALNMRVALRNGLEGSSEETSFHDESLQDDREDVENNAYHVHPAGEVQIHVISKHLRWLVGLIGHCFSCIIFVLILPVWECTLEY